MIFSIKLCKISTISFIEYWYNFFITSICPRAVYNKIKLNWLYVIFLVKIGFVHFGVIFQYNAPSLLPGEYKVFVTSKI